MDFDLVEGGWVSPAQPVPGWESFHVYMRAELVDGAPAITALSLEPRSGARPRDVALTQNRLRTFPVGRYAAVVYQALHLRPSTVGDLIDAMTQAQPKPRAATTPEEVGAIYARAREAGDRAPRMAVARALNISPRTADRYISQARRQGLLARYREVE